MRNSAAEIHAELLQNLRTQGASPRGPQMFNQLAGAFVLPAGLAVMRVNQDVGVDEIFGIRRGHRLCFIAGKARRATEAESNPGSSRRAVVPGRVGVNGHSSCARARFAPDEPPASR